MTTMSTAAIETHVDLSRGRLESMLKVLDVDGAVSRAVGGWAATGRPWTYDGERYERVARERAREQQSMLAYEATGGCRMEFLRRELDDPEAAACGRCDNCTGQPWPADVPQAGAEAARERLSRPGVEVEPRKMWPSGMKDLGIDASGKIRWMNLTEDFRVRTRPQQVLQAFDGLSSASRSGQQLNRCASDAHGHYDVAVAAGFVAERA